MQNEDNETSSGKLSREKNKLRVKGEMDENKDDDDDDDGIAPTGIILKCVRTSWSAAVASSGDRFYCEMDSRGLSKLQSSFHVSALLILTFSIRINLTAYPFNRSVAPYHDYRYIFCLRFFHRHI